MGGGIHEPRLLLAHRGHLGTEFVRDRRGLSRGGRGGIALDPHCPASVCDPADNISADLGRGSAVGVSDNQGLQTRSV